MIIQDINNIRVSAKRICDVKCVFNDNIIVYYCVGLRFCYVCNIKKTRLYV